MPSENSVLVSEGMKRICADFSKEVLRFGFKKTAARVWSRDIGSVRETIYFHRTGSSYGAPRTPSVDIRVELSVRGVDGTSICTDNVIHSSSVRRSNGYAYHHRFNAKTWSTYDRCLEELVLFMSEFAEPWFAKIQSEHLK